MIYKEYPLTVESVDEAASDITAFCKTLRITPKEGLRYRISAEEVLNTWIDRGVGEGFTLKLGKRLGKPYITLIAKGLEVNPFEEDDSPFISTILTTLTNTPKYNYQSKRNVVTFRIAQKQMNKLLVLLLTLVSAAVLGTVLRFTLPDSACAVLLNELINPLYAALFRMLGCVSGPLILLSVMWGLYGIGDTSTLGLVGKRLILTYISVIFCIAAGTAVTFPLFNLSFMQQASDKSSFGTIFEMLLDIIPANILEPLSNGNTLQIIFLAVIFGIAMLFLGRRVHTVAEFVDQINCIVQFLMELISKLIPSFVFLIVIRLILNNTLALVKDVWILALAFIGVGLVICAVVTVVTAVRNRVSPLLLVKKSLPTFSIAITTASSAACFGSNVETCEKKLGIDASLTSFGIPLGMVMFKSSTTAYYLMVSLFFAKQTGVACSASWLFTAVFLAAMLAIATPPIPGGGVVAYTVLFTRLGIPDDALAIVLSVDILFDFVRTALNMYNLPLMLVNVAAGLKLLNKDTLRAK